MLAWQIARFGIDSMEFVERAEPEPGPEEVLVQVHAVSFNYRDLLVVKGLYNPKMALPRIPCSDGAGQVLAVGSHVKNWKTGDRVAGIFMQNWVDGPPSPEKVKGALGGDIDGMLAERVVLKESGLVRIPAHLNFAEAATLPCAAVTAWNALAGARLMPGATILIQGTGGVSLFALQLAKLAGLRVLCVSSSDENLARARELGLDASLNYRGTPDWDKWVLDQTGGEGVDLIVEVGGAGTLPKSLRSVRMGGQIAQIGVLSGPSDQLPLPLVLHKQVQIKGIYVGSRRDFEQMNRAIELARLRPVLAARPWADAPASLRQMEEASHLGKLVVTMQG
ncbi:MAG: NAD(P)-dependent alcohol dehydrogenase [Acidobacteriota bacterium]|nr:NAD(P)-dependent alcohol dehydrogenase [Acidobacteriota bacterium]